MRESCAPTLVPSSLLSEQRFRKNKFGTIVRALWPVKPAYRLAEKLGCSERAAQFYIDGERKPSAACVKIIVDAIFD